MSRQKHSCVMMGPVTVGNRQNGRARRDERGSCPASPGRGMYLKGDKEFRSQCPIDESLPEWFDVLDLAEGSTGR